MFIHHCAANLLCPINTWDLACADQGHPRSPLLHALAECSTLFAFFAKGWDDGCLHMLRGKQKGRDLRRYPLPSDLMLADRPFLSLKRWESAL